MKDHDAYMKNTYCYQPLSTVTQSKVTNDFNTNSKSFQNWESM